MNRAKTYYFITGLIAFAGLFILATVFFRERIAFCDTAYQAVWLLIEQRPQVNWVRAGSCIPQIIPLIAIWLHASLRTVMVLHSLSFFIFFLAIYLIAYRISARRVVFTVIPLYLLLIQTDVFYWPQSELQQGMLWLCLYAVWLYEERWKQMGQWTSLALHFVFILWAQSFHPLLVFPLGFLVVYYYGSLREVLTKRAILHTAICGAAFGLRAMVSFFNDYERSKMKMSGSIKTHLPHFFSLGPVHTFTHRLYGAYLPYALLLMAICVWLAYKKDYLKVALIVCVTVGYWTLIMLSAPLDIGFFYTENMLLPLGFIAALPIAVDYMPSAKGSIAVIAMLALVTIRIGSIYQNHTIYTDRKEIFSPYYTYIDARHLNGVFVSDTLVDKQKAIITWGSGYESLLLSSLKSPDSCCEVQFRDKIHEFDYAGGQDGKLVTIYGFWDNIQLPARYFKLRRGQYEVIDKRL